ncbi:MAG: DUF1512 family protein [Candidatus Asgardarchaeia archaeon]
MIQIFLQLGDDLGQYFYQMLMFLLIIILSLYSQKLQMWSWMNQIKAALLQLKRMDLKGLDIATRMIKKLGRPSFDPLPKLKELQNLFIIEPVERDPSGVLVRLEHLLDLRRKKFRIDVRSIAPNATNEELPNIENTIEASMALHQIFRIIRHYYLMGKKTNNIFYIAQIQMQLPEIMRMSNAYFRALRAFSNGIPIGDGAGILTVTRLRQKYADSIISEEKYDDLEVHVSRVNIKDREVIIVRALGPGGRVGKPGEAVRRIAEKEGEKLKRIVTVDAGLKMEGDKTGEIIVGIGAAIGDPGPEKYKMEVVATEMGIPIDAIVIKESIEEAVTPMIKEISNACEKASEVLETIIENYTKPGDHIIIAGIGNSTGVGLGLQKEG